MFISNLWRRVHVLGFLGVGLILFLVTTGLASLAKSRAYAAMSTPAIFESTQRAVINAAGGDVARAREIVNVSLPGACEPDATTHAIPWDAQACNDALAANKTNTDVKTAITSLLQLNITNGAVRALAKSEAHNPDQDLSGWSLLPAGKELAALSSPPTELVTGFPNIAEDGPASHATLLAVAAASIKLSDRHVEPAKAVQEGVKSSAQQVLARTVSFAALAAMLFVALAIVWEGAQRSTTRWRAAWLVLLVLIVAAALAPDSLKALSVDRAPGEAGKGAGILDAPALVLAQLVDFAGRFVAELFSLGAVVRLCLLGAVGLLYFWQRPLALPIVAYALLILPVWSTSGRATAQFAFSPFDPMALTASPTLALAKWAAELFAVVGGVVIAQGIWAVVGERALTALRQKLGFGVPQDQALDDLGPESQRSALGKTSNEY